VAVRLVYSAETSAAEHSALPQIASATISIGALMERVLAAQGIMRVVARGIRLQAIEDVHRGVELVRGSGGPLGR
jgi:hypothetical protein